MRKREENERQRTYEMKTIVTIIIIIIITLSEE